MENTESLASSTATCHATNPTTACWDAQQIIGEFKHEVQRC